MSHFLGLYRTLSQFPLGRQVFNIGIGFSAPFFGKISPDIAELDSGYCMVVMKDRRSVRNHIGTINAGALCTLAELAGGLAVDAATPPHLRWIPKGMTVSYLCKGKGTLTGVCSFDCALIKEGEIVLPVVVSNSDDEEVMTADITFHISQKNKSTS